MTENIENIITLMQTDRSENAPQDAIIWSKNLFRARATENVGLIEKVARLVREISAESLVAGERSGSAATARQQLFEADDISVDIRIEATETGFDVSGQVLGTDETAIIRLGDLLANTDDFGSFKITGVKKGEYEMTVQTSGSRVTIKSLEIS